MTGQFVLFHGTDGDSILSILREGAMRPDARHELYFSVTHEDVFAHGGDAKRHAAFGFKAEVTLPPGASQRRVPTSTNRITVVVTSALPVPVRILELYMRPAKSSALQTIRGVEAIRAHLLRS
jgi:hypothetical protein